MTQKKRSARPARRWLAAAAAAGAAVAWLAPATRGGLFLLAAGRRP